MSATQRLAARSVGKHYGKIGGFVSFNQFVRFMRKIESPDKFTGEQISVAWAWAQKAMKQRVGAA